MTAGHPLERGVDGDRVCRVPGGPDEVRDRRAVLRTLWDVLACESISLVVPVVVDDFIGACLFARSKLLTPSLNSSLPCSIEVGIMGFLVTIFLGALG